MPTPVKPGDPQTPAESSYESLIIQLLHLLPTNSLSRAVGSLADLPIPRPLRASVMRTFADSVGANLDEVELELEDYPTVGEFLTRKLRDGLRPVNREATALVSPADSLLSQVGLIEGGMLTQVKGRMYSLADLLVDRRQVERFKGGWYFTLYLSPPDYHRVHAPVGGKILGYRYQPGHLYPVKWPEHVDNLFCINERVAIFMDWLGSKPTQPQEGYQGTPVAAVMVGATCVGRMTLAFDPLQTNQSGSHSREVHYQKPRDVERFDELGMFCLGSTVILLVGDPNLTLPDHIRPGVRVRAGERLALGS